MIDLSLNIGIIDLEKKSQVHNERAEGKCVTQSHVIRWSIYKINRPM